MNKMTANIICAFVFNKNKRRKLRNKLLNIPVHTIIGSNNKIVVVENGKEIDYTHKSIPNLTIEIYGNDNLIYIPDMKSFISNNLIRLKSNNAEIRFGKSEEWFTSQNELLKRNTGYRNLYIGTSYGNNQKVEIGNNIEISGAIINMGESNCHLIIEDFCMLSNNITFQMSDAHSVLDKNSMKIINRVSHPVVVGEHSWISRNVIFTKNASISPNTIVGNGAVVTKQFNEQYIAIAGNPAKIIKREILWDHTPPSLWKDNS